MPLTLIATPGDPAANTYTTLAEAQTWWDSRLFSSSWDALGTAGKQEAALALATKSLDMMLSGYKELIADKDALTKGWFRTWPAWTGMPATVTQALAWPRIGMFDANNNPIDADVVPQRVKDATSELAGQLGASDRYLDNQAAAQGITSVKAGSVMIAFNGSALTVKVLPEVIWQLLVPSWMTDEIVEGAVKAQFLTLLDC